MPESRVKNRNKLETSFWLWTLHYGDLVHPKKERATEELFSGDPLAGSGGKFV